MKCEQCDGHLSALLDDELDSELKAAVQQHVERCAACQSALEELRAVDRKLATLQLSDDAIAAVATAVANDPVAGREPLDARGGRWKPIYVPWVLAAVAAGIAAAVFMIPPAEPAKPIVGRLVRATGSVEVWVPGSDGWQPLEVKNGLMMQVGARVRTLPSVTCEIETVDDSKLRLDETAELILHAPGHVEVVKGQVWSLASGSKTLQVDASRPDPQPTNLLTMTCPSNSEFQWNVNQDYSACQSLSGSEIQWNLAPFMCPIGPGEKVTVDTHQNVSRSKENSSATKIWQLPLLAIGQTVDGELADVVEPLLVNIGSTKAGYLSEQQIRGLGPAGAIPLLAYVQSASSQRRAELRRSAMRIASELADESALRRLDQLRSDDDEKIAEYARSALQRLK